MKDGEPTDPSSEATEMVPSVAERMDRALLDHGTWLAKDVDKVMALIRQAYADGRASMDAEIENVWLAFKDVAEQYGFDHRGLAGPALMREMIEWRYEQGRADQQGGR